MLFLALVIWIYGLINLSFFSVDYYIISKNIPVISTLFEYKIFIIIFLVMVILIKDGIKGVVLFFLYIFFFPFIFLWKILKVIHKNDWYFFVFSVLNGFASIIDGFKYRLINFFLFCISIFFSFILYGRYLSMISMVCAFLFLVSSYVRAIIDSIKTPYIYKAGKKLIKIWTGKVENVATYIGENDEKDQVIIINGNKFSQKTLGAALITSGAYYFTSNVIDSYKNRNMIFVYNVALFLYLWLCIVFSISIMNYTLWIIDPIEFSVSENIGFFDFIFYSFREMAFADVDNIKAIMICSKSLQMIDNFTFIFLGAIMAIAIFTNKNEKFIRENEEVSNVLKSGYREINNNICAACNISDIENIKSELEVVNNGLYKILKFLLREV